MLVLLATFKVVPALEALWLSLTRYDLLTPPRYVGFQNYLTLLQDPLFHRSVAATVYYVVGTSVPIWFLSLGLALLVDAALPARGFLRLLFFAPAILPLVAHASVWRFMLHPYGLLNTGLEALGFPPVDWLGSARAVIPGLIVASDWRLVPYFMLLYLAGLQDIPEQYAEAAALDGASAWQRFRFVTLPALRPTILLVVVSSVILTSKAFTGVLMLSGGGPDDASRVLPLFIYQTGLQFLKLGLASAASVLLLLGTLAFLLVQLRLFRDDERG
jgi:multiple sugar transport system permease protein